MHPETGLSLRGWSPPVQNLVVWYTHPPVLSVRSSNTSCEMFGETAKAAYLVLLFPLKLNGIYVSCFLLTAPLPVSQPSLHQETDI